MPCAKSTREKLNVMAELYVELRYGNCAAETEVVGQKKGTYDHLIERWKASPFPENDSVDALSELQELSKAVMGVNSTTLTECLKIDRDLVGYIYERLDERVNKKLIKNLVGILAPSVVKLKKHYQRPRPFQLAYHLNVPLFPFSTQSAHSPSYPSGHTAQTRYACNMLATLYPHLKETLEQIQETVANSRIQLGVHFPSDNELAFDFADDCYDDEATEKVLDSISDYST